MEYAIEIDNLTKKIGNQTILDNLSFKIKKNSITSILGFSGAGKSTLMKHMLGLMRPTSGSVKVLGQTLSDLDSFQMREFRQHFGMLFQYAALFDSFSALENVMFPLREFSKMSEEEMNTKAKALLRSVALKDESFFKLPSELSGGMRKRVGLARALALSPSIMLYDEPTTGLDPITTHRVNELIVETANTYKDRGLTSIVISHDIKATIKISDYIAFLDHGRIVEYLETKEFVKSNNPIVREFLELSL